jgi:hypothetical protein
MQVIHRLMREENVENNLRIRISNYIEYIHKVILIKLIKKNLMYIY